MSVFSDLDRRMREACNGRIRTVPGNWVFEPTPKQQETCQHVQEDATGRTMYLIKQRGAWCHNPEVCDDKYPKSASSGNWFVPWAHCRKCEHYRKGGTDGLRYPHCAWARRERGGDAGAVRRQREAFTKAVAVTNEIMGK